MNANDVEYFLDEESEFDETEWEFAAAIHPQFKDAIEFGRACRSLAIPESNSEECATN